MDHEFAFIYHRYNLSGNPYAWEDHSNPTIASIASLRAVNQEVPIYVLDTESDTLEFWGDYPYLLNFNVVHQPIQIPIKYDQGHPIQQRMVSRMWDVWTFGSLIAPPKIVYSDADVFWLKDPLPFASPIEHFHGDSRGDGFFAYAKHDHDAQTFINCWKALTVAGIVSDEMRTKMRISGYNISMYGSEMAYMYLINNGMRHGWRALDPLDHYYPGSLKEPINPDAKCLHLHSGLFGRDRLGVVRRVREFNDAIRSVLPSSYADLLMGTDKPDLTFERLGEDPSQGR